MQASIAWSYNLLTAHEQALLRRVSVFVDGWTLEAAGRVAGTGSPELEAPAAGPHLPSSFAPPPILEGMAQLVEKSLVVVRHLPLATRYSLLETIRLFAWERLAESGEAGQLCEAH